MSTSYPSNLSNTEWECLQRPLPSPPKRGRLPTHSLRSIFDAIFSILRTGCLWRYLPCNFPRPSNGVLPFPRLSSQAYLDAPAASTPSGTTRAAREEPASERCHHGCAVRVKAVEESAGICGFDAHKQVTGRKWHLLVDTLGIPCSIYVTPADVHDTWGARCLFAGMAPFVPRLKKIWADAAYRGQDLAGWCPRRGGVGNGGTHAGYMWLQHSASEMGSRTHVWLAFS